MSQTLELTCPMCAAEIVQIINEPLVSRAPQLCYSCRALLVIDPITMALRRPSEEEEDFFLTQPAVTRAIQTLGEYHQRHGPPTTMNHPPDGDPGEQD